MPLLGIDIHSWSPNSTIETGEHILSYFLSNLTSYGCEVFPIIGYDRWEDDEYSTVLKLLSHSKDRFILRLDSFAFEDMVEEEPFIDTLEDIISSMDLDTQKCSVVLDFGDLSKTSIINMQEQVTSALEMLNKYKFGYISIAGCSVAVDINSMVPKINSTGVVVRKESKVWKAVKAFNPDVNVVFGDYGIASPNVGDGIIAPDANGKIRYTIQDSYFVVRGYSRRQGEKGAQMHELCNKLVHSGCFMGADFSWGDSMIEICSQKGLVGKKIFKGSTTNWVSIDTVHHVNFVHAEVQEFEKKLAQKKFTATFSEYK